MKTLIVVASPALLAMAMATLATRWGIGLTPDASIYLEAAQQLALGNGFVAASTCDGALRPVVHFPPLYPWLLALIVRIGIPVVEAARWLQVLLVGSNVVAVAAIVLWLTRVRSAALIAGLLMATSLGMLESGTAAWSEPLSLLLGVLGLAWSSSALERPRMPWLVAGALAIGLSALTRYVAATLGIAAVIGHLFLGRMALRQRVLQACVTGVVSAVPLGLFALRNVLISGSPTDRPAALQALGFEHLSSPLLVVGSWLVPGADRLPLLAPFAPAVSVLGLVVVVVMAVVARGPELRLFTLFMATYVALLLLSIAVFDHASPLDQRNLAPLFPFGLLVLVSGLTRQWAKVGPVLRRAVLAFGMLLVLGTTVTSALATRYLHASGRGYLSPSWQATRLFARVNELPPEATVYSNFPDAVFRLTRHKACSLPAEAGAVAILYFEKARRFSPHVVGAQADPGPGLAAIRPVAQSLGLTHEEAEANAVLFTRAP